MLVSVVIPTHKRPYKVMRAIDSALNQTYQNLEVVIVSDGYDKETEESMIKYKADPRVNFFSYKEAQGGNYARNMGIERAKGKYIAFLDDDDVMEQTKVEKQVEVFQNNNKIGLVYTGFKSTYPNLGLSYTSLPKQSGDLSRKIFASNYIGSTSRVMVEKSIVEKVGMFDISLPAMQDYDLWIRICQITQIGYVSEPLLVYINEDENNQISKSANKKKKAIDIITKKYVHYFEDKEAYYEEFDKRYYVLMLNTAQSNNDKSSVDRYINEYLSKYNTLKDKVFVLKYKIPYKWALKFRSFIK